MIPDRTRGPRFSIWGLLLIFSILCGCGSGEPVNHQEELPEGRVPSMPKDKKATDFPQKANSGKQKTIINKY
jgi:hypothetical protein